MRLVDADYIKESVKRQCDNCRKEGMKWMADSVERAIIEELDNTPTAQSHWIPCSERLPDNDVEVFVYLFKHPSPYIAWVTDSHWYTDEFDIEKENEPIAWMPLPKPYRGENDG